MGIFTAICIFAVAGILLLLGLNHYMISSAQPWLLTGEQAMGKSFDCILVLGAGIREDNRPSLLLEDRIRGGVALYHLGVSPKLLMSGDHGRKDYDEVNVMKRWAIRHGVPSGDIFMDHAGFSTYDSMYRAKAVFRAEKLVIVTQKYHLSRAIYIARRLGLDASGVASEPRKYRNQSRRDAREVLARAKDVCKSVFRPAPVYLGEAIPVSGDGDITNDRQEAGDTE